MKIYYYHKILHILKFQKIMKSKWQKINYHPTWQALFRERGGTCRGTQAPSPFLPKKRHLTPPGGGCKGYQVPAKSPTEQSLALDETTQGKKKPSEGPGDQNQ
jgi:hypothetical protein